MIEVTRGKYDAQKRIPFLYIAYRPLYLVCTKTKYLIYLWEEGCSRSTLVWKNIRIGTYLESLVLGTNSSPMKIRASQAVS